MRGGAPGDPLSLITAHRPPRLTKHFALGPAGELQVFPAGNLTAGHVRHVAARDLAELAQQLDALRPDQAPAWGLSNHDDVPIVTSEELASRPDAIARGRRFFTFSDGPGVLMLDHDGAPPSHPAGWSIDTLIANLFAVLPELANASMLIRTSASAGIETTAGTMLRPATRWRVYIPVTRAADIPEAGKRITARFQAAGLVWFVPSKSGAALERGVFDEAVWQAERLDFAAAPVLAPGLQRNVHQPELIGDPAQLFDLSSIVLDEASEEKAAANVNAARHAIADQAQAARSQYVAANAPRIAAARGMTLEAAATMLRSAAETSELPGDFMLTLADGRVVCVDDLLTRPEEFDGAQMRDPLDPEYRDDPRIATARLAQGVPMIYSHAHGGARYRLHRTAAVIFAPSGAATPAPADPAPMRGLTFAAAATGWIDAKLETVFDALQSRESGIRIALDVFQEQVMIDGGSGKWRAFSDADYGRLRADFGRRGFKAISPEVMKTAVLMAAEENKFDSAIEWANSLAWDGVGRIGTSMPGYYKTVDTPYTRAVGAYLFTALAARALKPGAQVDMVPVFVGLQGERKTSAVRALSPDPKFFAEINLKRIDDDNMARRIRGKFVGEIAELRGLAGRDQESLKAWITRREEQWRPLFREFETTYGRRIVFIGTANEREFLDDPTGERRWLPLIAGRVDVEGLERDCEQLWAEGIAVFKASGVAWQDAERLARAEHANFKVVDPWTDPIEQWLAACEPNATAPRGHSVFRLTDVGIGALFRSAGSLGMPEQKRMSKVLRSLGYENADVRIDGRVLKAWRRAAPPPPG